MRGKLIAIARERRRRLGWTQLDLARCLGSSPSRVCKMEVGDRSVSVDFVCRALQVMGASLVVELSQDADPLEDAAVSPEARRAFARALLRRQWAKRIAARHRVDAGDVAHVLYNLELPPLARIGSALSRARLGKPTADQR